MSKEVRKYARVKITDETEQKYKYYISIFITAFVILNASILVWRIGRLAYWGYIDHILSFVSFDRIVEWAIPAIVGMWILSPRLSIEDDVENTDKESDKYRESIEGYEEYDGYQDEFKSSDYAESLDERRRELKRIKMFRKTYFISLLLSFIASTSIATCFLFIVDRLINQIIAIIECTMIIVIPIILLWNIKSYRKQKARSYYQITTGPLLPSILGVLLIGAIVFGIYIDRSYLESGNAVSVWLHQNVDVAHSILLWSVVEIIACVIVVLIRQILIYWQQRKIRQLLLTILFVICELELLIFGFAAGSWFSRMDYIRFEDEDFIVVCSDAEHLYCCKIEYVEENDMFVDQNRRVILNPNGVRLTRIEGIERIRPKHEVIPIQIE